MDARERARFTQAHKHLERISREDLIRELRELGAFREPDELPYKPYEVMEEPQLLLASVPWTSHSSARWGHALEDRADSVWSEWDAVRVAA